MIQPTIGRVVWYWPHRADGDDRLDQPYAAIVARVWNDRLVNLTYFEHSGRTCIATSVRLLQDDDQPYPNDDHAQWMPYQVGQAGKAQKEADTTVLAGGLNSAATPSKDYPSTNLDFGEATKLLKGGLPMSRAGWNGKGLSVYLVPAASYPAQTGVVKSYFGIEAMVPYAAYLAIKNADGTVSTWAPSVGDALAEDWAVATHAPHYPQVDRSGKLETMPDPTAVVPEGLSDEQVARVCHEVNRAYCAALGDHSQAAWEDAPEWQRASARMGVDLHRMLPDTGPETSHIGWSQQKANEGWTYGPIKDAVNKTHPCLVPFNQLEPAQQAKDFIFKAVVNALTPL